MFTGRKKNVAHWIGHPNFMLIVHDVVEPIMLEVRTADRAGAVG
jgi:UDP-glucuronate decarboxylase